MHMLKNDILKIEDKKSKPSSETGLGYSVYVDRETKLVDIPLSENVNSEQDQENISSAIAMIPEGYDAIVVAFADQDKLCVSNIKKLITTLSFCTDNVIYVVTYDGAAGEFVLSEQSNVKHKFTIDFNKPDCSNLFSYVCGLQRSRVDYLFTKKFNCS